MSLGGIDWAGTGWAQWLQVPVFGNRLGAWLVGLGLVLVVAMVLPASLVAQPRRLRSSRTTNPCTGSRHRGANLCKSPPPGPLELRSGTFTDASSPGPARACC